MRVGRSAVYTSLDLDGTPRFESTFHFSTPSNMIAFENSPFLYAPMYGGFCAHTLAQANSTSHWSRSRVGPSVDLVSSWRMVTVKSSGLTLPAIFHDESKADEFVAKADELVAKADAAWHGWWGAHGIEPPYAQRGGPFNQMCFVQDTTRDCSQTPQPLPPGPARRGRGGVALA